MFGVIFGHLVIVSGSVSEDFNLVVDHLIVDGYFVVFYFILLAHFELELGCYGDIEFKFIRCFTIQIYLLLAF